MSRLKAIRLPVSANIKLTLVFLAFLIVAGMLFYTQQLVEELKRSERKTIDFYANTLQTLASNPEMGSSDMNALAYDLSMTIDFPMILTDPQKVPQGREVKGRFTYSDYVKNIDFDSTRSPQVQKRELTERIKTMQADYDPLPIYLVENGDSTVINYIFYEDSATIQHLRWLPYAEIVIIAMFILVGYISFSYVKRNEQSNIWVGMAKETAHQLGTPLSSLLGWIELLRLMPEDTAQVLEAASEMERDVNRLNKVAHRFSKIGSSAELKVVEINAIIGTVVTYFERRLPHLGKKVTLGLEESGPVYVAINVDLFEWVFENLVRNAADAIDHPNGKIRIKVREIRGFAVIDVIDNGRGIDPKIRKDIFRPGFSTKQRGWGLGLSLAKRIVEDYHGGKIILKESSANGTTFRIRLDAVSPADLPQSVKPLPAADVLA